MSDAYLYTQSWNTALNVSIFEVNSYQSPYANYYITIGHLQSDLIYNPSSTLPIYGSSLRIILPNIVKHTETRIISPTVDLPVDYSVQVKA